MSESAMAAIEALTETHSGAATTYGQTQQVAATEFPPQTREAPAAVSPKANQPVRIRHATEPSSAQTAALKSAVSEAPMQTSMEAPGLRAVKAVIGESMGQGNFIVHCYPPTSPKFEIRLPEVVIPRDLRTYGRSVFVSIDIENGIRRPVVTPREITEPLPRLPEQDAIERWLTSFEC
jgi:hypothetical protein